MASFNSTMLRNPDLVKTAIDELVKMHYEEATTPGYFDASDAAVFNQMPFDRQAWITDLFKGSGLWSATEEEQDLPSYSPVAGQQKTSAIVNYNNSFDIPLRFFEDNMENAFQDAVRDFAFKAKRSQDFNACGVFRNAGSTALTSDGVSLVNDNHVNINGDIIDNRGNSLSLTEANLNTGFIALQEQKDQAGVILGTMPATLVVPTALFKTACEVTQSEWRSGTGNNDVNYFSSKYPGLTVKTSPYLGAAAGGSDSNWFLLGKYHKIYRLIRKALTTDLVDYKTQRNNNYICKGEYREIVTPLTYEGVWGSV